MNPAFSTYLDFARFSAAIVVVLHHLGLTQISGGAFDPVGRAGEDAVMVFFVLSGYVIAYVGERDRNLESYAINRLSRLYSVVVPALLVTVIADWIGTAADPSVYAGSFRTDPGLLKTLVSLAFSNQLWSLDVRFQSNVPYWSISYEFWYYVLFACVFFATDKAKWLLLTLWAVVVGPCILLLLPVWWLGVWMYQQTQRRTLPRSWAWLCSLAPLVLYALYRPSGLAEQLTAVTDRWVLALTGDFYYLHKARFFLHDYIVGALVAVHLFGVHSLCLSRTGHSQSTGSLIRRAAGYTFSIYLFHFPVLLCLSALSPLPKDHPLHLTMLVIGTAAVVLLIAPWTEGRKDVWRNALLRIAHRMSNWMSHWTPRLRNAEVIGIQRGMPLNGSAIGSNVHVISTCALTSTLLSFVAISSIFSASDTGSLNNVDRLSEPAPAVESVEAAVRMEGTASDVIDLLVDEPDATRDPDLMDEAAGFRPDAAEGRHVP